MGKIMKILFVLPYTSLPVPATKGGAIETLLTILLQENEVAERFEFVFICPDDIETTTQYKKSTVYIINNFNDNYEYDYKAASIAKKEKPDYIIMEGFALRLDGCFRNIVSKKNIAIHIHSEFERRGVFADSFGVTIATSQYIAKKWNSNSKENEKNTFILSNSINTELFKRNLTDSDYKSLRKEIGFKDDDFVIIFCGRIIDVKGVKEAIEAIEKIDDESVKLLIIGSDSFANGNNGEYANEVIRKVKTLGGKVFYKGYVPNDELWKWYKCSNLQLIPSLWEEAFGLVAVEGMASGLPIVYTDSGALPEVVAEAGEMIIRNKEMVNQIESKILYLKNNPQRIKKMIEIGKQRVKKYSSAYYYDNFCSLMDWWRTSL